MAARSRGLGDPQARPLAPSGLSHSGSRRRNAGSRPMQRRTLITLAATVAVTAAAWPFTTRAQPAAPPWPQRPVRLILPLGPGSGSDIGARLFAERLTAR